MKKCIFDSEKNFLSCLVGGEVVKCCLAVVVVVVVVVVEEVLVVVVVLEVLVVVVVLEVVVVVVLAARFNVNVPSILPPPRPFTLAVCCLATVAKLNFRQRKPPAEV